MLSSLGLMLMLFAAQDGQAPKEGQPVQAQLQSCVLEAEGWVCRYRLPSGPQPATTAGPRTVTPPPPAAALPPLAAVDAEAARQDRLIRRCADASWLSLCTPGDRREAKALQEAAAAKAALRREVTTLASQGKCPDAVRTALEGGDLALAKDIRDFCSTAK